MIQLKDNPNIPDTGISGVYEVLLATDDPDFAIKYFAEFGFKEVDRVEMEASDAALLYGYESKLQSIRLQNGSIDSHGLLRLLVWDEPKSVGMGKRHPRTIGQRITVMKTSDIFRIKDVFDNDRVEENKWLVTHPVADDLFGLDDKKKDFFNRPVIVRENAVYGSFFNHIFFQRYGYHIEGYGTVDDSSPLRTSEFTHHDFFINAQDMSVMRYMSTVLGLIPEEEPKIDSADQKGPREVFMLNDGEGHWYQGFVSPNNICGKLKFFIPTEEVDDQSHEQQMGCLGVTMHSFYTDKLTLVHQLAHQEDLNCTDIYKNEFGEQCFCIFGDEGCRWQLIQKQEILNQPKTELHFSLINN